MFRVRSFGLLQSLPSAIKCNTGARQQIKISSTLQHCIYFKQVSSYITVITAISPPRTVVPGGLMFYCCFFLVPGTLRRYISELPKSIAVKI